jgi:peptide/nickel transport system permease protein
MHKKIAYTLALLVALLAPWIAPFDPVKANFLAVRKPP